MCNRGITNCRIELEWNFLKNTGKIVRCAEIFTVEATVKSYGHFIRKNIDRIALQEGYTSEEYDTWLSMLDFNYEYIDYPEGTIWFTSDESITSEYSKVLFGASITTKRYRRSYTQRINVSWK